MNPSFNYFSKHKLVWCWKLFKIACELNLDCVNWNGSSKVEGNVCWKEVFGFRNACQAHQPWPQPEKQTMELIHLARMKRDVNSSEKMIRNVWKKKYLLNQSVVFGCPIILTRKVLKKLWNLSVISGKKFEVFDFNSKFYCSSLTIRIRQIFKKILNLRKKCPTLNQSMNFLIRPFGLV